jgi:hypothetical protein
MAFSFRFKGSKKNEETGRASFCLLLLGRATFIGFKVGYTVPSLWVGPKPLFPLSRHMSRLKGVPSPPRLYKPRGPGGDLPICLVWTAFIDFRVGYNWMQIVTNCHLGRRKVKAVDFKPQSSKRSAREAHAFCWVSFGDLT